MKPQAAIIIFFFLGVVIIFSSTSAQIAPDIQWQKCLGGTENEVAFAVQQTDDGGFIVAGYSDSDNGDVSGNHGFLTDDYWIVKLDFSGNIEWQRCLGGTTLDEAWSIQQTTDGGFVVAGQAYSNDGDVSGHHGSTSYADSWVVKLDASGNIEWEKSLGGKYNDAAYSIQQTIDGGFVIAGSSDSNNGDVSGNHGLDDYWIVKLDASGNIEWQKSLGGSSYDFANSIRQTTDGGFVVAGYSGSNDGDVSGNHGGYDYWVVKLDFSGNIEWQNSLGGSDFEFAFSIRQTTDGGFLVAGRAFSGDGDVSGNHGGYDGWIVKLDHWGNIVWQKCLGGSDDDHSYSFQQTIDGGFVVAGYSNSNDGDVSGNHGLNDYWILKLDVTGNIEWQKCLGGSDDDYALSIQQTTDGGFIVACYSYSNDGDVSGKHGSTDYWIVKLAPGCDLPASLTASEITSSSVKLNWSEVSGAEGYKIRYKIAGTSSWMKKTTTSTSKKLTGLLPDTEYVWEIKTYCTIAPNLMSVWSGKQFFTTLSEKQATEISLPFELSLFPNPTDGKFSIHVTATETQSLTVLLFDFLGREVYSSIEGEVSGVFTTQIDLSHLPSGTYFLKVMNGGESEIRKVVVEK